MVLAGALVRHVEDVQRLWDLLSGWRELELQDTRTDGRSAVMRIWINGNRKSDLWNKYGNGSYVYRDYSLAEGTPIKFQLCVGQYGTKDVEKCQNKTFSGKA